MTAADEKPCPKSTMVIGNHLENEKQKVESSKTSWTKLGTDYNFKRKIVWKNALGFLVMHLTALYGFYFCFKCNIFIEIGFDHFPNHAGQNCLYIWVRDHRQHHKYSDTDADPHNASRGFFFSHIGWLMSKKHPLVLEKGKTIDLSDLEADDLVMFQKKYYKPLYAIYAIFIPVIVPVYFWNESWHDSFFVCYLFRNVMVLNITWFVNSLAHLFGTKPFDKFILPVESAFVAVVSMGEGWHNYHHTFPWDYRAAELGSRYGVTTFFIELCSYFGLAYDLKSAPYKIIESRAMRTGDCSHPVYGPKKIRWQQDQERAFMEEEKSNLNEFECGAKPRWEDDPSDECVEEEKNESDTLSFENARQKNKEVKQTFEDAKQPSDASKQSFEGAKQRFVTTKG
ncbi:hypothetical protein JTB14_037885 [Gonioctena quinquepunctata]|nr:hypothetical protein JTB14_037885 [Gonioctena quinquepunctata]